MKGIIVKAAEKLVISKFGDDKWEEILVASDFESDEFFSMRDDIEDEVVMKIIANIAKKLSISIIDVLKAFAAYWIHEFIPEIYPSYKFDSAKEYINSIEDIIHTNVRATIPNAKPPLFEFDWINENELILTYISSRGLIDLAQFMFIEIGVKYDITIDVEKIDEKSLKLTFK